MRYAEFRKRLENALRDVGLFVHDADRVETINLADTVRHWKAYQEIRTSKRGTVLRFGRDQLPVDPVRCGSILHVRERPLPATCWEEEEATA